MFGRNSASDKKLFLKFGFLNLILFLLIYVPTNRFDHDLYFKLYFLWELQVPFIEWMIIPYHFLNLLFLLPFFLLPKNAIKILGASFALCTLFAGICYAVIPAELGYERMIPDGLLAPLYKYLYLLIEPTNLVPSLHVTYVTLYYISCVSFFRKMVTRMVYTLLIVLIISSTLFTHQHHLVDVISGILLATSVSYIVTRIFNSIQANSSV